MTQHELILEYLRANKSISPYEAFEHLGITKLATRIGELKKTGYVFTDYWAEGVNRFGEDVKYKRYVLLGIKN